MSCGAREWRAWSLAIGRRRHNYVGVSLQEMRATMQVILGVSLRARWDATLCVGAYALKIDNHLPLPCWTVGQSAVAPFDSGRAGGATWSLLPNYQPCAFLNTVSTACLRTRSPRLPVSEFTVGSCDHRIQKHFKDFTRDL